jgi:DNA-binding MarR family transcriptional regulator
MDAAEPSDNELASALRVAVTRILRRLRAEQSSGLSVGQFSALQIIRLQGPISAGEVAALERVQPPSMTKLLAHLQEQGLIDRSPHPEDRRQSVITATEAGTALLAAESRARDAWLAKQLRTLTTDERNQLQIAVGLLERLVSQ